MFYLNVPKFPSEIETTKNVHITFCPTLQNVTYYINDPLPMKTVLRWWWCEEADHDCGGSRDEEEDEAEVQEVDVVNQGVPPIRR
jgi:hypothetical protein